MRPAIGRPPQRGLGGQKVRRSREELLRQEVHESGMCFVVQVAYEDAIARKDSDAICEELGDLLLQIVFHSRMAEEQGLFDFDTVAKKITTKMIERHPHVFGQEEQRSQTHWIGQLVFQKSFF